MPLYIWYKSLTKVIISLKINKKKNGRSLQYFAHLLFLLLLLPSNQTTDQNSYRVPPINNNNKKIVL